MTPFLRLQVWLRRGPSGERAAAAGAAALALALIVWALVPLSDGTESVDAGLTSGAAAAPATAAAPGAAVAPTVGAPGASSGPAGSAAAGPAATASAAGATATAATGSGGSTAATSQCSGLRASDQGVTDKEVFVAVSVLNLVGPIGNETVGVRGNLEEIVNAVAAGINAEGGVACRKLRVKVYKVSPIDKNEQRSRCLEMIGDKPFAVIDVAGYADAASRQCFYNAKLPMQGGSSLSEPEGTENYPWAYGTRTTFRLGARNFVAGMQARGLFTDPAFKKLAVIIDECDDDGKSELLRDLAGVGVQGGKLFVYTLRGCGLSSPSDIGQAVVQARNSGASHAFLAGNPVDMPNFVRQADGLGWRPQYVLSDVGSMTNPAFQAKWPAAFDNALAITSLRTGERNSGIANPLVARCNDWMRKAGVKPSDTDSDVVPPLICDQFRLFVAAANGSGTDLVRSRLVPSLPKVGRFALAHASDAIFAGRKVFGGDFVRAIQWHADCTCWKVLDRDLHPGV